MEFEKLIIFFIFLLFGKARSQLAICLNQQLCENEGNCPIRDNTLAALNNRRCRKSCEPNNPQECRNGLVCLCARECGYSCINMTKTCPPPRRIPFMSRVVVYRKTEEGCFNQVSSSEYQFGDMAVYECQDRYSLSDPDARHFCTGRSLWSSSDRSECERTRCKPPTFFRHGTISNQGSSVLPGVTITYRCDPGYEINGLGVQTLNTTCRSNGRFSYPKPKCVVSEQFQNNPCISSPCRNGGSCIPNGQDYSCNCINQWTGNNCEIEINCFLPLLPPRTSRSPNAGSVLVGEEVTYRCNRNYAIDGISLTSLTVRCERNGQFSLPTPVCTEINPCNSIPCQNGGSCFRNGIGFLCICPSYASGLQCEIIDDDCFSSPCQNGGTCRNTNPSYTCDCHPEFGRRNCDKWICELPLGDIPRGIRIQVPRNVTVHFEDDELQVRCADESRILNIRGSTIRCSRGGIWTPIVDLSNLRCI